MDGMSVRAKIYQTTKKRAKATGRKRNTKPIKTVKKPKVILTSDPYNISLNKWETMS